MAVAFNLFNDKLGEHGDNDNDVSSSSIMISSPLFRQGAVLTSLAMKLVRTLTFALSVWLVRDFFSEKRKARIVKIIVIMSPMCIHEVAERWI